MSERQLKPTGRLIVQLRRLTEQVKKEEEYPYITFYRHKDTKEIHLFLAKKSNAGCVEQPESICSSISNSGRKVQLSDVEGLSPVNLSVNLYDVCSEGDVVSCQVSNFRCLSKNTARILAAFLQNQGFEICGTCVSYLYRTELGDGND